MQKMKMSYSKLTTQCPQKFKYQYIDRIKGEPSLPLILGSAIHSALEQFYDYPSEDRKLKLLQNLFRKEWKYQRTKNKMMIAQSDEIEAGKKGLKMLENFIKNSFFEIPDPEQREEFVEVQLTDDIPFLGRIDRLDKTKDGYMVVDYKSGSLNKKYLDFNQLFTYAYLMKQQGFDVKKSVFYYLEPDEIVERKVVPAMLEDTKKQLIKRSRDVYEAIEADVFQVMEGPLCPWCDYQDRCPAKRL